MQSFIIEHERNSRARFSSDVRLTPRSWYSYQANKTGHRPWSDSKPFGSNWPDAMDVFRHLLTWDPIYVLLSDSMDSPNRVPDQSTAAIERMFEMNTRFERWTSLTVETGSYYEKKCLGFFFTRKEDAALFRMIWES